MTPNNLFRSSIFRLALLYAAVFVGSFGILFAVTYWTATEYAAEDESSEITEEYAAIQDEAKLAGEAQLPTIVQDHIDQRKGVRAVYLLQNSAGEKITGNIPNLPARTGPIMINATFDGDVVGVRAQGYRLANGDYLVIGQDTSILQQMKTVIARSFGAGLVVTLILALVGGAIVGTFILNRVDVVSRTARGIIDGDISMRVPLRNTQDEFDMLGVAINTMLDRIDDLMRSMRQVTTDIAHDLRTPLARLRQRMERARRSNDVQDLHAAMDSAIQQVDSILETFSALLRIAQIEAGGAAASRASVNVSSLLRTIVEHFSPAAEDNGQRLVADIEDDLSLPADRELLTQLITNLVDNAIRHSPPGTLIRVQGRRGEDGVELAVADTGPGIPEPEREKVLRPFYRLEASRTTEGNGLGLSLVSAIAKRHRARLMLLDNHPGLRVALQFPI